MTYISLKSRAGKNLQQLPRPLWLSRLERCPVHRKAVGLIPGQRTYPGPGFDPLLGCLGKAANRCFSLFFLPALFPLSLSKSNAEDKKCMKKFPDRVSQSEAVGPAAWASSEGVLDVQTLRARPTRCTESESASNKPSRDSHSSNFGKSRLT